MADTYKLTIKLPSGAEFQGEGPEDSVRKDYQLFIEAIERSAATVERNAAAAQAANIPPGQQSMACLQLPPFQRLT
jgi:hypothetical protein